MSGESVEKYSGVSKPLVCLQVHSRCLVSLRSGMWAGECNVLISLSLNGLVTVSNSVLGLLPEQYMLVLKKMYIE